MISLGRLLVGLRTVYDACGFYRDDTEWEKTKFGWSDAIRTWDIDFLRDNPLAQFYLGTEAAVASAAEAAGDIASGAKGAARSLAAILRWAPYAAAGSGVEIHAEGGEGHRRRRGL